MNQRNPALLMSELFRGKHIRFSAFDYEHDPEIVSAWTHDPAFMRMMYTGPMRPLSAEVVKKRQEEHEKEMEKGKLHFFCIRQVKDDRLVGIAEIYNISWNNGMGSIQLGIGSPKDWHKGFGTEALQLITHYAFAELNLYRLSAFLPEYNTPAISLFTKLGFRQEVCLRQHLWRDKQRWNMYIYGILVSEWRQI